MQSGSCDCRLLAIAFATTIAHGNDPVQCNYNQAEMRGHLYQCLQERTVTPFPHEVLQQSKSTMIKSKESIDIYCHCRMLEIMNVPMIECTNCTKWFHSKCEKVAKEVMESFELSVFVVFVHNYDLSVESYCIPVQLCYIIITMI